MSDFRWPGLVWSALMVALPLLSVWINEYFGAYAWAPAIAGLLLIVAKVLASVRPETEAPEGVAADARRPESMLW